MATSGPTFRARFSYARAHIEPDGVALSFLLEAIGPGTERLAAVGPDDGLALVGPLGIGFREPADGTRALLVGGGIWGRAAALPPRGPEATVLARLPQPPTHRRRPSAASRRW